MDNIPSQIVSVYDEMFGPTPLFKRLDDILEEAEELFNYTNIDNLKEEISDLICTCFALVHEQGWTIEELVQMNLDKIKERKENGHYIRTGEAAVKPGNIQ